MLLSKHGKKIIYLAILAISASSVFLSLARTGYFFIFAGTFAIVGTHLLKRKSSLVSVLLVFAASAALLGLTLKMTGRFDVETTVVQRLKSAGSAMLDENKKSTWDQRMDQIKWLFQEAKDAPFPPILGLGITNRTVKMVTTDVGFINILINLGLYGILFILFWFTYFFYKAFSLFNRIDDEYLTAVIAAMIGCLAGMIVSLINFDYFTGNKIYLLIVVAVSIESISINERQTRLPDSAV